MFYNRDRQLKANKAAYAETIEEIYQCTAVSVYLTECLLTIPAGCIRRTRHMFPLTYPKVFSPSMLAVFEAF